MYSLTFCFSDSDSSAFAGPFGAGVKKSRKKVAGFSDGCGSLSDPAERLLFHELWVAAQPRLSARVGAFPLYERPRYIESALHTGRARD